jgi:hypothetical protein
VQFLTFGVVTPDSELGDAYQLLITYKLKA